jgi:two-component system response regulator AtoC
VSYTILIIDDDKKARQNVSEYLKLCNYEVFEAGTIKEGKDYISKGDGDIIILDVQLPDGNGLVLMNELSTQQSKIPVILITGYGNIEMAVDAMKNGAHDFLTKPIEKMQNLENSILRAIEVIQMRQELTHLRKNQLQQNNFVVGKAEQFSILIDQANKASKASVSVLITGETGTGKEVLANFIHQSGPRAAKPFVAINCAAIQPTVLESELFGYEAGAFTDAQKRKHGLMEIGDGGVLFLDEISSMPTDIQAKILRAIEEKSFRRVGGTTLINVDLQIIAASNRIIKNMIDKGEFREDLYYRLKVVDLHLPPLRERREDIPELIGFFVNKINMQMGKNVTDVSQDALKLLINYSWPGNIRELSNSIQRALLFCDGEKITPSDLPLDITHQKS